MHCLIKLQSAADEKYICDPFLKDIVLCGFVTVAKESPLGIIIFIHHQSPAVYLQENVVSQI